MGTRFSRLVSVAAAGGVLTGSLLLGGGMALAAPTAPTPTAGGQVVPAACGTTVAARPGDTVQVTPLLGLPFNVPIGSSAGPLQSISQSVAGSLCQVQVQLVQPVTTAVAAAAPALQPVTGAVEQGSRTALGGSAPQSAAAPAQAPAAAPAAVAPAAPAPMATTPLAPSALATPSPAFAPSFNSLPSSFLGSASPSAGSGLTTGAPSYDAGQLLGSAFPGLKAGAPAYLGYDPASAVTTASQVQALPVDGMSKGMGVPVMLAVLALAGVAAFVVRALVLRRTAAASAAAQAEPVADEAPVHDDGYAPYDADATELVDDGLSAEALTALHSPAPSSPAVGFPRPDLEDTELMGTARR
ncbi:hypothetical protein [Actinomycetospora sp. TBRC 11914]|uniref:hypothetical protein n=1 Tax=Actinomycetospora sp. TBRC 11914 TaxID=2729387 RepID=UPI00145E6E5D|nr:hypothetical protein [Actinomycetospora sp. TBRC 11914]NMO93481.1 hypothetical protein [Actinomycetospora sp. TBRC 11914]